MDNGGNKRLQTPLQPSNSNAATDQESSPKKQKMEADSTQNDEVPKVQPTYNFLLMNDSDMDLDSKENLELNTWTRCRVTGVLKEDYRILLSLIGDENPNSETELTLMGPWYHTRVYVNDLISVLAVWDDAVYGYKVDKDGGFLVVKPDVLISGTTVVGALFCQRKAVLQERFRGIDAGSKIMLIGSLVHEILQTVLEKSIKTRGEIQRVAKELLESQETAFALYQCKVTRSEAELEIQKFMENIYNFIQQYVEGKQPAVLQADHFQGKIAEIQDIEENLWIPELGLKGKVDVSVKIHRRYETSKIPLELKTGRASFSLEHKGQLILYQMMLTAAGCETDSGLLLYLREGIMKEIKGTYNEQRDLIMLRNELAYYLTSRMHVTEDKVYGDIGTPERAVAPFELPDPISHPTACNSCPYSTVCCAFGKSYPMFVLSESHPLRKASAEAMNLLTQEDLKYFTKWCGLLSLEEHASRKSSSVRSIWRDAAETRKQNGRAIVGLWLRKVDALPGGRYLHTFNLELRHRDQLIPTVVTSGEYVIVSTRERISIAAGFVYDLSNCTITINLERNLEKNYKEQTFIVDKHESQSEQTFNYTNLGILLDSSDSSVNLRSIIIQRVLPKMSVLLQPNLSGRADAMKILAGLNHPQRKACIMALNASSYMLIKGLPGSGKTQTLVAIIQLLRLCNKSVLITSHTHSAVDNLLLRLTEQDGNIKILRLGSEARIHPEIRHHSEAFHTADCRNEEDLAKVYSSFDIVAVTCLGTGHALFAHRKFDYCIVDEATQVLQPTVLRPLFFASKFILVGDPDQLPPLIKSQEAKLLHADESLFALLDHTEVTCVLTHQYRMNRTITKLANDLTYKGKLKCGTETVCIAALKLQKEITGPKWRIRALQTHIDLSAVFLDTTNCQERSHRFEKSSTDENMSEEELKKGHLYFKYKNYCEAAVVFDLVGTLLEAGYDPTRIGIIAPYRAQVSLLKKLAVEVDKLSMNLKYSCVEVNTVDQYQGRDKDVIFYSCTRTGSSDCRSIEKWADIDIIDDKRRLTVAVTRAKYKLVVVGDSVCLKQYDPFKRLMSKIPSTCRFTLHDGRHGFFWHEVLGGIREATRRITQ